MQHSFPYRRFPHRPPYRRPAGVGLGNIIAAVALGIIVYKKGVEEGKKLAESQRQAESQKQTESPKQE